MRANPAGAWGSRSALARGETLELMRLIWSVAHGLRRLSRRMAASAGVTGPERVIVRVVGRFPGISAGRLAEIMNVHPSTLAGAVGRLARRGFLSRRSDPRDGRRAALGLTAKGRELDLSAGGTVEFVIHEHLSDVPRRRVLAARAVLLVLAERLAIRLQRETGRRTARSEKAQEVPSAKDRRVRGAVARS